MSEHDPTTAEIVELLMQVYAPGGVRVWLEGRNASLDGHPIELMKTVEGRRQVYARAKQLAEGTFA